MTAYAGSGCAGFAGFFSRPSRCFRGFHRELSHRILVDLTAAGSGWKLLIRSLAGPLGIITLSGKIRALGNRKPAVTDGPAYRKLQPAPAISRAARAAAALVST